MANYKSAYTGAEIDAGIAKANNAIQELDNLDLSYAKQYEELPVNVEDYVGKIIQYVGPSTTIDGVEFRKGDFCLGDTGDSGEITFFWTNLTNLRNMNLATKGEVLTKTNIYSYTPTQNYHPATKKYVDDAIAAALEK